MYAKVPVQGTFLAARLATSTCTPTADDPFGFGRCICTSAFQDQLAPASRGAQANGNTGLGLLGIRVRPDTNGTSLRNAKPIRNYRDSRRFGCLI